MCNRRIALTTDGRLTICIAPPDKIGTGRCNHIAHQSDRQSVEEFINSIKYDKENNVYYIECNDKNSIVNDSRYEQIIKELPNAKFEDGVLIINKRRLEEDAKGLQHKGPVIIDEHTMKFLKLDEINPKRNLRFKDYLDYHYSSISEDIASSFLSCVDKRENFESLYYSFQIVEHDGKQMTGSLSDNYLYSPDEAELHEKVLSVPGAKSDLDDIKVDHEEFVEKVIDERDNEVVFKSMVEYFKRYDVDEEEAEEFILNQAAFDIMTCNIDRKSNSTNFVFVRDYKTKKTKPLNMDYGRCLVMEVGLDSYQLLKNAKPMDGETLDDVYNETIEFYMDSNISRGSIFNSPNSIGDSDLKQSVDFVLSKGFKPFELDEKKMDQKFSHLLKKVESYNHGELKLFTELKIGMFKKILNHKEIRRLWKSK